MEEEKSRIEQHIIRLKKITYTTAGSLLLLFGVILFLPVPQLLSQYGAIETESAALLFTLLLLPFSFYLYKNRVEDKMPPAFDPLFASQAIGWWIKRGWIVLILSLFLLIAYYLIRTKIPVSCFVITLGIAYFCLLDLDKLKEFLYTDTQNNPTEEEIL